MKKICREHPEYIKYARGAAITPELIDIVLNHPNFEKKIIYDKKVDEKSTFFFCKLFAEKVFYDINVRNRKVNGED